MSFRDLRRYESQKAAFDNYKAWQALSPDAKQSAFAAITNESQRAKPTRELGFLAPFNQVGTGLQYIRLPVLAKVQDGQGAGVGNALTAILDPFYIDATEAAPAGGGIAAPRYEAARLSFTIRSNFVKRNSRITKRAYMKPDVDTYSGKFGRSVANQTYQEAIVLMTSGINSWVNGATSGAKRSFKFTPEG